MIEKTLENIAANLDRIATALEAVQATPETPSKPARRPRKPKAEANPQRADEKPAEAPTAAPAAPSPVPPPVPEPVQTQATVTPIKPAVAEVSAEPVTIDMLRQRMTDLTRRLGSTDAVQEIVTNRGVPRLSEIDPAEYPAILGEIQQLEKAHV